MLLKKTFLYKTAFVKKKIFLMVEYSFEYLQLKEKVLLLTPDLHFSCTMPVTANYDVTHYLIVPLGTTDDDMLLQACLHKYKE